MDGVFKKIVAHFGSRKALADLLGIHQMTVYQWERRGRIPPKRCREIYDASNGAIPLHEMRPDVYPKPSKAA